MADHIFLIGSINEIGQQQKADNISGLLGEASFKSRMKAFGTKSVDGFVLRIGIDDFSDINERFGVELWRSYSKDCSR